MKRVIFRILYPVFGFFSLLWFLIRVIPKPSRATYPCIRASAPFATSFVLWMTGLFSSAFFFQKAKRFQGESKRVLALLSTLIAFLFLTGAILQDSEPVHATLFSRLEGPNQPMGEGKGIFPGRVVWVHEPEATDENCGNRWNDYWYQDDNTNQEVVNRMVSKGLQALTGKNSDASAWDALFRYFNKARGKGDVGYTPGEKIVIKINFNGVSQGPDKINTSPQVCYAVLDQLIRVVGVAQSDIWIGDPNINFDTPHWNKCHSAFPNVHYWGKGSGQTPVVGTSADVLFASDGGKKNKLPQAYVDATYLINIPVFKKHHRAGISLCAKNHFGSVTPFNSNGAFDWHYSLPCPDAGGNVTNGEYGVYRCFVDIMAHKDLGGKTLLYLVDGLWSSINWGHPPIKWRMSPFNNDWPNSLFFSQDPVAIESVGFDFLYHEFGPDHPTEGAYDPRDNHGPFPHYAGVQDYLHQTADASNRPNGFVYDPERDGTPIPASLGVHEHWNNAEEKKYSRNLGLNKGIELVYIRGTSGIESHTSQIIHGFALEQNYPNPFNPGTEIQYRLSEYGRVNLSIYTLDGKLIRVLFSGVQSPGVYQSFWDGNLETGIPAASGVYVCQLVIHENGKVHQLSKKMILAR